MSKKNTTAILERMDLTKFAPQVVKPLEIEAFFMR